MVSLSLSVFGSHGSSLSLKRSQANVVETSETLKAIGMGGGSGERLFDVFFDEARKVKHLRSSGCEGKGTPMLFGAAPPLFITRAAGWSNVLYLLILLHSLTRSQLARHAQDAEREREGKVRSFFARRNVLPSYLNPP